MATSNKLEKEAEYASKSEGYSYAPDTKEEAVHPETQEPLPSYERASSSTSHLTSASSYPSQYSEIPTHSQSLDRSTYPAPLPPTYTPSDTNSLLVAIPQTHPNPTAPFLLAYAPSLEAYGIPPQRWSTFLTTLSSHLTAGTSQRLLSHAGAMAASVPKSLGKNLASTTTNAGKHAVRSAKHLNPFGIVGSAVGLAFGVTGAVVGSVVGAPGKVATRVPSRHDKVWDVLEEVNGGWLAERGLRAELMGMESFAGRVGTMEMDILGVTSGRPGRDARVVMEELQEVVGKVVFGAGSEKDRTLKRESSGRRVNSERRDEKDKASFERGAESVGLNVRGNLSAESGQTSRSTATDAGVPLELGHSTMWLVITRVER